jgi:cytoskeletal protein RodZ
LKKKLKKTKEKKQKKGKVSKKKKKGKHCGLPIVIHSVLCVGEQ